MKDLHSKEGTHQRSTKKRSVRWLKRTCFPAATTATPAPGIPTRRLIGQIRRQTATEEAKHVREASVVALSQPLSNWPFR